MITSDRPLLDLLTLVGLLGLALIYAGYPIFFLLFKKRQTATDQVTNIRSVSLIIASWQDATDLLYKIRHTAALNLTNIDLQVIVVTDQEMPDVLAKAKLPFQLDWVRQTERLGKAASLNQAITLVKSEIIVCSDANTNLNADALQHLRRFFHDAQVGAVAGEKRVLSERKTSAGTEQLYWKYESMLKRLDARVHSVIGGAGELFAMRAKLFEPLPDDCILDDLELSWQVIAQGYRIAYAADAISVESPSLNLKEEAKRKIRIAAGAYQFLDRHPLTSIFNRSSDYGWQFLFRKWSRWVLAPIFLLMALLGNIALIWLSPDAMLVRAITWMQGGFYLLFLFGWLLLSAQVRLGWLAAPFYFVFMHFCQIRGWFRYRFGTQSVAWEKSHRIPSA